VRVLGPRSRGQLCRRRRTAKIAKSWAAAERPGILVGPVTTPNPSSTITDATALARATLGPIWPRVRRIPLIRREVRESLSDNALELVVGSSELLVVCDCQLSTWPLGDRPLALPTNIGSTRTTP